MLAKQLGREERVRADNAVRHRGAMHNVCCSAAPPQYPRLTSLLVCVCVCWDSVVVPLPAVRHPRDRVWLQERAFRRLQLSPGCLLCRPASHGDPVQGQCLLLMSFWIPPACLWSSLCFLQLSSEIFRQADQLLF